MKSLINFLLPASALCSRLFLGLLWVGVVALGGCSRTSSQSAAPSASIQSADAQIQHIKASSLPEQAKAQQIARIELWKKQNASK